MSNFDTDLQQTDYADEKPSTTKSWSDLKPPKIRPTVPPNHYMNIGCVSCKHFDVDEADMCLKHNWHTKAEFNCNDWEKYNAK